MASSISQLEQRVAALEAEVTNLKSQMQAMPTTQPWWEQIAETFQHDPMMKKPCGLGGNTVSHYDQGSIHKDRSRHPAWSCSIPII
jgi:hypothetical protein